MNTNKTNTTGTEFFDELLTSASSEYPDNRFPMFHLDENGDCLEVVLSAEAYNGERVDSRVTIYRGIDSNKMVGVLVKGLTTWVARILTNFPGLSLDLQDQEVKLELLFRMEQYQSKDPELQLQYKNLRDAAGDWNFTLNDITERLKVKLESVKSSG